MRCAALFFKEVIKNTCYLLLIGWVTCLYSYAGMVRITFQVNASREKGVNTISLAGDFQGWNPRANQMSQMEDCIYSTTVTLRSGTIIAYRFVKNGYEWEEVQGTCAKDYIRSYKVPATSETLSITCFNTCGACDTSSAKQVTFQVDMSAQTISPNGVFMVGNFQGWSDSTTALEDMGNGIYAIKIPFYRGSLPVKYKFLNGAQWGTQEVVEGACQVGSNRYVIPPLADTILPVTCFESCTNSCVAVNKIKVACVGNSITYGVGVTNKNQSYTVQLNALLGNRYAVRNFGHSGATLLKRGDVPYYKQEEYREAKAYNPDVVIIKLGTNDSKYRNWRFKAAYEKDYAELIDAFSSLPSQPKIFLCLMTKAFSNKLGVDEDVMNAQIRPLIQRIARSKGVSVIDLFDATKDYPSAFRDGVHPNDDGVEIVVAKISQVFTSSSYAISKVGDSLFAPAGKGYQWYFNGNPIASHQGGNNSKIKVTWPGEYKVGIALHSVNGDYAVSNTLLVTRIASQPNNIVDISSSISLLPNPLEEETLLAIENDIYGKVNTRIVDDMGNLVMSFDMEKKDKRVEQKISFMELPQGVYYVEVSQPNAQGKKRVIKN